MPDVLRDRVELRPPVTSGPTVYKEAPLQPSQLVCCRNCESSQRLFRKMSAVEKNVLILDPSDKFRPEKSEALFRNYTSDNVYHQRVRNTYHQMHSIQNLEFAKQKKADWCQFNHAKLPMMEAVDLLDNLVDESDPDIGLPNSIHAYQTAERIREKHPDKEWLQFTGFIHDVGKILAVYGEPQYAVVGDTFVVGCAPANSIVFGPKSFAENPDYKHPVYSTQLGIYEEKCGLDNVVMSWGHDEYLYQVLLNHKECSLPEEALNIIRFHSFYPWHTGGDYAYLCNNKDAEMLRWVQEFNQFDLYSKSEEVPDMRTLRAYYQTLTDKFCPGVIHW